jgi:Zn-dependent protease with chaperone function
LDAEHPLPGADLIVLAPFLVGLVLSWAFYYDADREAHRAAHRLLDLDPLSRAWLEQLPTPVGVGDPLAFGGRASYVLFQVRQKLALAFVPLSVLLVQKDLRRLFPEQRDQWESVTSAVGAVAVGGLFLGMPYLLRLLLGLKPLPAGPLRDRLEQASIRLRLRLSDFLLWDTRGAMANAFVVGLTPWLRYVVFTDRLLEEFTHEETEAVLGHEVGHIKHRHMLFYLAFLTMSLMALWTATLYFQMAPSIDDPTLEVESSLAYGPVQAQYLRALPLVGVALAYLFGVFGLLSRWCERQADVFGCRAVSCARRDCDGHTDDQLLPTGGKGLCRTGVRTFVQALEKVAVVNGISRDRPGFFQSWQHSTIARRVAFLERIAVAPSVERGFQIQIAVIQWSLFLALVVWLTWASCSGG